MEHEYCMADDYCHRLCCDMFLLFPVFLRLPFLLQGPEPIVPDVVVVCQHAVCQACMASLLSRRVADSILLLQRCGCSNPYCNAYHIIPAHLHVRQMFADKQLDCAVGSTGHHYSRGFVPSVFWLYVIIHICFDGWAADISGFAEDNAVKMVLDYDGCHDGYVALLLAVWLWRMGVPAIVGSCRMVGGDANDCGFCLSVAPNEKLLQLNFC